jgi:hypothetical protein
MYITSSGFDWTIMSIDGLVPNAELSAGGNWNVKCIDAAPVARLTMPSPRNPNCCPFHGPEKEPVNATRADVADCVFVAALATGSSESVSRSPAAPQPAASGTSRASSTR